MSQILSDLLKNPQMATALRRALPKLSPMSAFFAREVILGLPSLENREAYIDSIKTEKDVNLVTASLRNLRSKYLASGRNNDQKNNVEVIVEKLSHTITSGERFDFQKLKKAKMIKDMRERASRRGDPLL